MNRFITILENQNHVLELRDFLEDLTCFSLCK